MNIRVIKSLLTAFSLFIFLFLAASATFASHSWLGYHWARTSNPFTLKTGDNLTSNWDPYLVTTASDWSASSVLDMTIVPGTTTAKRCRASSGRVEVCNSKYGNNGWLGIAQVWVSGGHILQGATKLNDTYFNTASYNTPAWRNLVMCQEVGHVLGLDHQDENFGNANLGTCMDYTNDPTPNQHPNAHDYEMLESIYAHLDTFNSYQAQSTMPLGQSIANSMQDAIEERSGWGKVVKNNGNTALFEREFAPNFKLFTFVIWSSN